MVIYIDIDNESRIEGWSSTYSEGLTKIELPDDHPFLVGLPHHYLYINGKLIKDNTAPMRDAKKEKRRELNNQCQEDILSGFTVDIDGTDYQFSYDREAQHNFQERWALFQNSVVDSLTLTAHKGEEDVRLKVDEELYTKIYLASVKAKEDKISRLRDVLIPMVERATNEKEVELIKWSNQVNSPEEPSVVLSKDNTLEVKIQKVDQRLNTTNQHVSMTNAGLLEIAMLTMGL